MNILYNKKNIANRSNYDILLSPLFIIGLIVFIINDHYLKTSFPGLLTGKLSDFLGLFLFPIFICAFFPKRKNQIYILTFALFFIWKLPITDYFIDFWNKFSFYRIGRTVDYTDYIAFTILPFSYFYNPKKLTIQPRKLSISIIAFIAFFAFCATSPERIIMVEQNYHGFSQQMGSRTWCIPNQNVCIIKDYESTNYRGYRLIDSNGMQLNAQQYAIIKDFQYNQLLISAAGEFESKEKNAIYSGGLWGVMTYKGVVLVKPTYEKIESFNNTNKMFIGKTGERWSLIDSLGNIVLEPIFDSFYPLNNYLVAVELRGKQGIVDLNGDFVIPLKIDEIKKSNTSDSINILINNEWKSIDAFGK